MIKLLNTFKNQDLLDYLSQNIQRVFSIKPKFISDITTKDFSDSIIFVVNLNAKQEQTIMNLKCRDKFKIIYLGELSSYYRKKFNFIKYNFKRKPPVTKPATKGKFSESSLKIDYLTGSLQPKYKIRKFERYDFEDEWNNYGYGKIELSNSIWSISNFIKCKNLKNNLGVFEYNKKKITFVSKHDLMNFSLLYINRQSGLFDGFDISVIEKFVNNYLEKPNFPIVSEIPHEYDGLVTMRLDCDEDILSSKKLFSLYKKMKVPFSLAILTSIYSEKCLKYYLTVTSI